MKTFEEFSLFGNLKNKRNIANILKSLNLPFREINRPPLSEKTSTFTPFYYSGPKFIYEVDLKTNFSSIGSFKNAKLYLSYVNRQKYDHPHEDKIELNIILYFNEDDRYLNRLSGYHKHMTMLRIYNRNYSNSSFIGYPIAYGPVILNSSDNLLNSINNFINTITPNKVRLDLEKIEDDYKLDKKNYDNLYLNIAKDCEEFLDALYEIEDMSTTGVQKNTDGHRMRLEFTIDGIKQTKYRDNSMITAGDTFFKIMSILLIFRKRVDISNYNMFIDVNSNSKNNLVIELRSKIEK